MSQQLPVGDVLNEAFLFAFHRWTSVFRLGWLPMVLSVLAAMGLLHLTFDMQAIEQASEATTLGDLSEFMRVSPSVAILMGLAGVLAMLFLYSGFMASVFRLVALGEDRPGIAHLRLDGPAMRVVWAQIIMALVNWGVFFILFLLFMTLSGQSFASIFTALREFAALVQAAGSDPPTQPPPEELQRLAEPMGVIFRAALFSAPVLIFLNLRLAPFLGGSAAENRLLLLGAFRMTAGQFWSLFGLYVLLIMALFILLIIYSLFGGVLDLMSNLAGGVGAVFAVLSFIAAIVYQVFVMGLQLSLQGIVYRRLKTGE